MKKRNINRDLYPVKWEELVNMYGEEKAVEEYYRFSRTFSEEKYILKYGETEGKLKFLQKNSLINYGMSLNNCINRHGKENGEQIYDEWRKKVAGSLEVFVQRHGEKEGNIRYNEFCNKCIIKDVYKRDSCSGYNNRVLPTQLEYWIEISGGDVGQAKILLADRQSTSTIDKFIKKYGEEKGREKYIETNKKKTPSLDNFIKLYGETEGIDAYQKYIEKLKSVRTKEYMVTKHGEKSIEK